jgi:prepilin-type N-terminal cleavage/methylation domain-containing protein
MSTTANSKKRRARRRAGGFTLVELLTVISIIAILMAMLAPSMYAVFFAVRKEACKSNLRSIVSAANNYALADSRQRLPTIRPSTTKWGDMKIGNPGCLALLIDAKLADRELFLCPEAQSTRGHTTMALDANYFTYKAVTPTPPYSPPLGVSTLSYSYISMVYNTTTAWNTATGPQVAALMTMNRVPPTLVVLADQNPRCVFGTTAALTAYDSLYGLSGIPKTLSQYAPKLKKNSLNHKNKGQNVARWDSSVKWITDANNPNTPDDDIYTNAFAGGTDENLGRRKDESDSYLIP